MTFVSTRRVYRDGNSEYLLNKTPCRLARHSKSVRRHRCRARGLFDDGAGQDRHDPELASGRSSRGVRGSSRHHEIQNAKTRGAAKTGSDGSESAAHRRHHQRSETPDRFAPASGRQSTALSGVARRFARLDTHHSRKQLDSKPISPIAGRRLRSSANRKRPLAPKSKRDENNLDEINAMRSTNLTPRLPAPAGDCSDLESEIKTHRNRIEFNRQRAEELSELIERSRNDIAVAETKRAQQGKEIQEANALIEKTSDALQTNEAELNQAYRTTLGPSHREKRA